MTPLGCTPKFLALNIYSRRVAACGRSLRGHLEDGSIARTDWEGRAIGFAVRALNGIVIPARGSIHCISTNIVPMAL